VDVWEENSAGFLFGKVFKIINVNVVQSL
jgi:hypothetical protein